MSDQAPLSERKWVVELKSDVPADIVAVIFAWSRAPIRATRIEFLGDSTHAPLVVDLVCQGRLFEGRVPGGVLPKGKVELSVKFLGNVPRLALVLCVGEKDASDALPRLIPTGLNLAVGSKALAELAGREIARLEVPRRFITNAQYQEFKQKSAQIDKDIYILRRNALLCEAAVRLFFLELDEQSDVNMASPAWKEQMLLVSAELFRRIEVRARRGCASEVPLFGPEQDPAREQALLDGLKQVSGLFDRLVKKHLSPGNFGVDLVDWAFEQFTSCSAGAYHHDPAIHRQIQTCGVPNGSEFFKFAELGLTCLDKGVLPDLWRSLLPGLVRCSHLFVEQQSKVPDPSEARMLGINHFEFQQGRYCHIDWREQHQLEYQTMLSGKQPAQIETFLRHRFTSILAQALKDTTTDEPNVKTEPLDPQCAARIQPRFAGAANGLAQQTAGPGVGQQTNAPGAGQQTNGAGVGQQTTAPDVVQPV